MDFPIIAFIAGFISSSRDMDLLSFSIVVFIAGILSFSSNDTDLLGFFFFHFIFYHRIQLFKQ